MRISDCSICGKVFHQVCDGVALDGKGLGVEGDAGRRDGVDAGGVVDKVGVKATGLDFVHRQVARELVDDGRNHLGMGQLLGADVGQPRLHLAPGRRITLAEVARRRAQLSIGPSQLQQEMKFAGPSYFLLPPFVI